MKRADPLAVRVPRFVLLAIAAILVLALAAVTAPAGWPLPRPVRARGGRRLRIFAVRHRGRVPLVCPPGSGRKAFLQGDRSPDLGADVVAIGPPDEEHGGPRHAGRGVDAGAAGPWLRPSEPGPGSEIPCGAPPPGAPESGPPGRPVS